MKVTRGFRKGLKRTGFQSKYWRQQKQCASTKEHNEEHHQPNVIPVRHDVIQHLWEERAKREKAFNSPKASQSQYDLVEKTPQESVMESEILLSSDYTIRDLYISPYNGVRIGRLLESLDGMAGQCAHTHCDDGNPDTRGHHIVTASVDGIYLHKELSANEDIKIRGKATYVGRSSMDIEVSILSKSRETKQYEPAAVSNFVMVALDPLTSRPAKINPLIPETEEEKEKYEIGKKKKGQRSERARRNLWKTAPTDEELKVLHNLFMNRKKFGKYIRMEDTHYKNMILCQPSNRNLSGNIFGGYLMRESFELAFMTATKFLDDIPEFVALEDLVFRQPVHIGDFLMLNGSVTYTSSDHVQVEVTAKTYDPKTKQTTFTNVFNYTFAAPEGSNVPPVILPLSYVENMKYLEARRRDLVRDKGVKHIKF